MRQVRRTEFARSPRRLHLFRQANAGAFVSQLVVFLCHSVLYISPIDTKKFLAHAGHGNNLESPREPQADINGYTYTGSTRCLRHGGKPPSWERAV